MKKMFKQAGQGMTEYIIIVALIAVAAIGIYGFFGDTIRGQMGVMTEELAGKEADRSGVNTAATAAKTEGSKAKSLGNYEK
tara:strand:- start:23462 stop:23704 length:243 start_codon:yes stop_codon:yes gene_type:complete